MEISVVIPVFNEEMVISDTIIEVKDFLKALNLACQVKIDFGNNIGIKKSSAQITTLYKKEDLLGKHVIAVVNFPKKQIANLWANVLSWEQ